MRCYEGGVVCADEPAAEGRAVRPDVVAMRRSAQPSEQGKGFGRRASSSSTRGRGDVVSVAVWEFVFLS